MNINVFVLLAFCEILCFATSSCSRQEKVTNDGFPPNATALEIDFIDVFREAFENNNSNLLIERVYWAGIPESHRPVLGKFIEDDLEKGCERFELVRVSPDDYMEIREGRATASYNLPVKWCLIVEHHSADGVNHASEHMLGEFESKIMFLNRISE